LTRQYGTDLKELTKLPFESFNGSEHNMNCMRAATLATSIAPIWLLASASEAPFESENARNEAESTDDQIRVLIVEDEILLAIDMRSMLENNGCTVVGLASSAEQAVKIAERERPDLVLMDVRLEGQRDGVDAAIEIRNLFDIPSLFVTANADARIQERAQPARPFGFIMKPFSESMLLRALRALE
jgi:two-component system, response regulator PdtaR